MRVLVFDSGRADGSPLAPVIGELKKLGVDVCRISVGDEHKTPDERFKAAFDMVYTIKGCDSILLLGDRYETLAAASAATIKRKPIYHIHGGENTAGSFDDQSRDAITALAQVHFAATARATLRIGMIAKSHWVFHSGAPGLCAIKNLPKRKPKNHVVLTYHPETNGYDKDLLPMIDALLDRPDLRVIWTGVNKDPGADFVRRRLSNVFEETPLDFRDYIKTCRQAALVIGNSSSGVIECPTIGVPSVDVGIRQFGRERGPSVFSGSSIPDMIEAAIDYDGPFDNPYFRPDAAKNIATVISKPLTRNQLD